jgi:hypothetical protein
MTPPPSQLGRGCPQWGDTRAAYHAARGAKGPYPPGPRPRSHYAQPGRKVQSLQPS